MSRYDNENVISARITFDRTLGRVTVQAADGTVSAHDGAAHPATHMVLVLSDESRLHSAIAGLELAQRAAVRSLIVAECAMSNVAGQYGIPHAVRSITQP